MDAALSVPNLATWYAGLVKPAGNPPNWVFGPVWTVLYVLMGVAAWRVWRRIDPVAGQLAPLRLWGWLLLVNALWTPVFFSLRAPLPALGISLLMVLLAALTMRAFRRIDRVACRLLAPFLAWTCYATYLNAAIWWLNGPGSRVVS